MNVVLPDNSELELPAGATGLDAARAIGSRARRAGGADPRRRPAAGSARPARRRREDPDPDDPRHRRPRRARRAAPLVGSSARRGGAPALPGRQGGDRPADRERLLLRLRLPGADHRRGPRADRGGGQAGAQGRSRLGAPSCDYATRRVSASWPRTSRTRSSSSTPPRATSPSTSRATSSISAAARTCRTRSRSRRSS